MKYLRLSVFLLTLGLTATALAGGLPRLPKDRALRQGTDSPGVVTFRHATHVDGTKPDCTTCHPALFSILPPSATRAALTLKHADMEKGAACGKCHDGKSAHGFDDCATCHAIPKER
ncbi:MAG TPA: c(7)-type cytochrome triheme domain-containing protein [Thermoanaerobaculia bacterium]|jgi:c(7)-type cytochrome triheme protein